MLLKRLSESWLGLKLARERVEQSRLAECGSYIRSGGSFRSGGSAALVPVGRQECFEAARARRAIHGDVLLVEPGWRRKSDGAPRIAPRSARARGKGHQQHDGCGAHTGDPARQGHQLGGVWIDPTLVRKANAAPTAEPRRAPAPTSKG